MSRYNTQARLPIIIIIAFATAAMVYFLKNKPSNDKIFSKTEIEDIVKNTISNSPDLIISSVENYQIQQQKNVQQQLKNVIENEMSDIISNSPSNNVINQDITVVEFFDYNCGYCKRGSKALKEVAGEDKKIKIVYKELPILNENSFEAAKTALAIFLIEPSKYIEFHDKLMNEKRIDNDILNLIIEDLKIDKNTIDKAKLIPSINEMLENNKKLAQKLNIQGTPAFIINNEIIPGALDATGFKEKIAQIRSDKK